MSLSQALEVIKGVTEAGPGTAIMLIKNEPDDPMTPRLYFTTTSKKYHIHLDPDLLSMALGTPFLKAYYDMGKNEPLLMEISESLTIETGKYEVIHMASDWADKTFHMVLLGKLTIKKWFEIVVDAHFPAPPLSAYARLYMLYSKMQEHPRLSGSS